MVSVSGALNNLWSAKPETPIDFDKIVTYCDRLRIRQPGDTSFKLGEHIDGGSVERTLSDQFFIHSLIYSIPKLIMCIYNRYDSQKRTKKVIKLKPTGGSSLETTELQKSRKLKFFLFCRNFF